MAPPLRGNGGNAMLERMELSAATPTVGDGVISRLRRLAAATSAGALAGFAIGGIGGRLAMLLLRITSDPSLHGLDTDDGFTIGIVSGETTFLLIVTTIFGAVGGAAYFLTRPVLSARRSTVVWGALGAAIGGAAILRPVGVDFTLVGPHLLAVVMFIAIPAAGAAATSVLTERWLARDPRSLTWLLGLAPMLFIAVAGPTAAVLVALALLLALTVPASWLVSRATVPAVVVILGRAALAVAGAIGALALVRDALEIL